MRRLGLIGGTNADFPFEWAGERQITTEWGSVPVQVAVVGDTEVLFVRRHGRGHERLSSQVDHRANIAALAEQGVVAIIATTVCGVCDPDLPLGHPILFDDLYFPDNRLPDGKPCTFFDAVRQDGRGHYIFASPFSASLREVIREAARSGGVTMNDGGTYGYVLGPRFNTAAEVRALRATGVRAVSQTAGPEAVLAGELEVPYALIGFGVDYANAVQPAPTPVDVLDANIAASRPAFATLVSGAAARLDGVSFDNGFVYRFE